MDSFKDFKSHLPEGPLLNTDSLKLKTEALLAEHYVQYSRYYQWCNDATQLCLPSYVYIIMYFKLV